MLEALISGRCAFVCQRTGRGKSLCYETFTTSIKSAEAIVLIVSPLLSIMDEQTRFLNFLDISAVMLSKDLKLDNEAQAENYQYIYGSHETFFCRDD